MKRTAPLVLIGLVFLVATFAGAEKKGPDAAEEAKVRAFVERVHGNCRVGRDPATNAQIFEIQFPSGFPLEETALAEMPSFRGLQGVDLTGIDLIHPPYQALARCKELRSLNLSSTRNTDKGFSGIEQLTGLEDLDLSNSTIGDASLASLGKLVNLARLNLYNGRCAAGGNRTSGPLSDKGLAFLPSLAKLKILDLSYLPITDAGAALLAKTPSLEALDLSYAYGVTDKSLPVFRGLPKLKYIRLQPTGISGKGVAELMSARPDLRVGM